MSLGLSREHAAILVPVPNTFTTRVYHLENFAIHDAGLWRLQELVAQEIPIELTIFEEGTD